MISRFFGALFKSIKKDQASQEAVDVLRHILENEAATRKMRLEAEASREPYVLLRPAVPLPARDAAGWFGGAPRLPEHVAWPEIDGEPLCFACQINLSALPANIWSGLGPRQGWLALFLHPRNPIPKALHVDGDLRPRQGPAQSNASWFWPRAYGEPKPAPAHSPQWPITIMGQVGEIPVPVGWRKGKAPGFSDPRDTEIPDLADLAFHPFNAATLVALLDGLQGQIDSTQRRIDAVLAVGGNFKVREQDKVELSRMSDANRTSADLFARIKTELAPFTERFAFEPVSSAVSQLALLTVPHVEISRTDSDGYSVLAFSTLQLRDKPSGIGGVSWWYYGYAGSLYCEAVRAYTGNPEALHPELRARFEKIWRFESLHECGAIGHVPTGHIYTPFGPDSPNEVLLELPTSTLVGWTWGDNYSIVFIIKRADLARGNFDNVVFDIAN